jgi:hypothetical protein
LVISFDLFLGIVSDTIVKKGGVSFIAKKAMKFKLLSKFKGLKVPKGFEACLNGDFPDVMVWLILTL